MNLRASPIGFLKNKHKTMSNHDMVGVLSLFTYLLIYLLLFARTKNHESFWTAHKKRIKKRITS